MPQDWNEKCTISRARAILEAANGWNPNFWWIPGPCEKTGMPEPQDLTTNLGRWTSLRDTLTTLRVFAESEGIDFEDILCASGFVPEEN